MRHRIAVLALTLMVMLWGATDRLNSQTQADWDWTNKQFPAVLDTLMPLQDCDGLSVSYRANRDLYTSTPEYWFVICLARSENQNGSRPSLAAHVRIAQPVSIYDQLMTMHRENPSVQDGVLAKNVRLQSFDVSEMNCPALKVQMERLKTLPVQLPNINLDYIKLHPMIHAFHVRGFDGDVTMSLTDGNNALVRWAQDTRGVLDTCTRKH